jgi:pimeloyl-ACP methyl ester carboxylesterase
MNYFLHEGLRLHYLDVGYGSPVLLLHGLGSCANDWHEQISQLSKRYRVIALDLRGHGFSDSIQHPLSIEDLAKDACALMQYLGLDHYQVVGFSLGGMVAFNLALLNKSGVKSLTIINSGPGIAKANNSIKFHLLMRVLIIRFLGMRFLGRIIGRKLFPLPGQEDLKNTFEYQMTGMDVGSYQALLKAISDFSVTDRLKEITMPVLVLAADQDYTSIESKMDYVQEMDDARLTVIINSRHASPLDQPQQVNRALLKFLKEHCNESSMFDYQVSF